MTNAVVQNAFDQVCSFYSRRSILPIDSFSIIPDDEALRRNVLDGLCVFLNRSEAVWHRTNIPFQTLIDEVCEFLEPLIGKPDKLSFFDAFQKYAGIDPFTDADCSEEAVLLGLDPDPDCEDWNRDRWLRFLFEKAIQPRLTCHVIFDFLPSQIPDCSTVKKENDFVAEHFEIYFEGRLVASGQKESSSNKLPSLNIGSFDLMTAKLLISKLV